MPRIAFNLNDYISLAVMTLMAVALVTGQADASLDHAAEAKSADSFTIGRLISDDRATLDLSGYLGEQALKVSIEIAADIPHFRGEDE